VTLKVAQSRRAEKKGRHRESDDEAAATNALPCGAWILGRYGELVRPVALVSKVAPMLATLHERGCDFGFPVTSFDRKSACV